MKRTPVGFWYGEYARLPELDTWIAEHYAALHQDAIADAAEEGDEDGCYYLEEVTKP